MRQSNTVHTLARVTHSLSRCKNPRPLESQSSDKENLDSGCGNEPPTTSASAKMKFIIPFPNNNNAIKGAYFSYSSSTPSATKKAPKNKSDSDADNVPVSVSEEEEAQMESEDEEKDSKAAPAPTIEGEEPCVSPPVDEEDNDN